MGEKWIYEVQTIHYKVVLPTAILPGENEEESLSDSINRDSGPLLDW